MFKASVDVEKLKALGTRGSGSGSERLELNPFIGQVSLRAGNTYKDHFVLESGGEGKDLTDEKYKAVLSENATSPACAQLTIHREFGKPTKKISNADGTAITCEQFLRALTSTLLKDRPGDWDHGWLESFGERVDAKGKVHIGENVFWGS